MILRRDLQGLRAIAILVVILAHAGFTMTPGGFIGVDVFFVLSGYLITGVLLRELEKTGRIAFISFYARRLKRLLPALALMIIVSSGFAIWLLSEAEARSQLASSPFAVTWISNFYFNFVTFDYFDELSNRDMFLHTWSLGVEEQFYFIWPMILLFLYWLGIKSQSTNQSTNQSPFDVMLAGLIFAFIASLLLSLYWSKTFPLSAFYLMPSRIWQFAMGAIVYRFFQCSSTSKDRVTQLFGNVFTSVTLSVGLVLIVGSAIALNPGLVYPGLWALFPSFGAALIIVAGYALPKDSGGLLAHPVLVWLGDRSYSLYLWHWPIFMIGFSLGLKGQVVPTIGMILLSMLVATLSYQLIERPFWKGRWSHAKPSFVILISVLVMVSVFYGHYRGLRPLPPSNTTPDISHQWRSDVPVIYGLGCDAWYAHARVEPCVFGVEKAEKTVVFLGDSIGAQWYSMIPEIFAKPVWRVIVLTKSACAMVDEDYYYSTIGKTYQVCTDWRNAVLDELKILKPDVLIMGSSATYEFSETQWIEGSARVLKRVNDMETTVFVIPGTPSLGFDGPSCVSRHLSSEGRIQLENCMAKGRIQEIESAVRFLERAVSQYSNVHMLNLNDLVCPGGNCRAITEQGIIVFRDSQHLTDSFVRSQVPFIRERLHYFYDD
ncbi:MAG: acyltransferase [Pseudomonadales bacterium]|nr:acyltransferase [Pseudomonadales bacterium]